MHVQTYQISYKSYLFTLSNVLVTLFHSSHFLTFQVFHFTALFKKGMYTRCKSINEKIQLHSQLQLITTAWGKILTLVQLLACYAFQLLDKESSTRKNGTWMTISEGQKQFVGSY